MCDDCHIFLLHALATYKIKKIDTDGGHMFNLFLLIKKPLLFVALLITLTK